MVKSRAFWAPEPGAPLTPPPACALEELQAGDAVALASPDMTDCLERLQYKIVLDLTSLIRPTGCETERI